MSQHNTQDIVATKWAKFEELVIPGAPKEQRHDMRQAFYAGAITMFHLLCSTLLREEKQTAADEKLLNDLDAEMIQFIIGNNQD